MKGMYTSKSRAILVSNYTKGAFYANKPLVTSGRKSTGLEHEFSPLCVFRCYIVHKEIDLLRALSCPSSGKAYILISSHSRTSLCKPWRFNDSTWAHLIPRIILWLGLTIVLNAQCREKFPVAIWFLIQTSRRRFPQKSHSIRQMNSWNGEQHLASYLACGSRSREQWKACIHQRAVPYLCPTIPKGHFMLTSPWWHLDESLLA